MNYMFRYFFVLSLLFLVISCKNETNKSTEYSSDVKEKVKKNIPQKKVPLKVIAPIDNGDNSVFTKLSFNNETKLFAGALTSANLTNMFSEEKTTYTVFASSNDAFKKIGAEKMSLLFSDRDALGIVLKNHIVKGMLDSSTLVKKIKQQGGKYKLKTLMGESLTASMSGSDIVIKDTLGNKAVIGKSDIKASNGIIHIIDILLSIN